MIWWFRWLRAWLSNQSTLAALLAEKETALGHERARQRRDLARYGQHLADLSHQLRAARREAESLDAGNQALRAEVQQEREYGTRLHHRINAVWQLTETSRMPADVAAEVRHLLTPDFVKEPDRAGR